MQFLRAVNSGSLQDRKSNENVIKDLVILCTLDKGHKRNWCWNFESMACSRLPRGVMNYINYEAVEM